VCLLFLVGGMAAAANGGGAALFSEEELRDVSGVRRCEDFVEVTCGCTSHRYGDAVGRLRVYASGDLEVSCECTPGCREGPCSPLCIISTPRPFCLLACLSRCS
jgi:hypothetical protein